MNVNELYGLTKWIQTEIVDKQVQQKYQDLHAVLQTNSQPNQQKKPFESQVEELLETIKSVRLEILTKDQISFLSELGIAPLVGDAGVKKVEDILFRNAVDVATCASKIQEMINGISEGVSKSNQISTGLEGCVSEYDEEIDDEVLIRVSFLGEASMSNVRDFKDWGNSWHEIGRGIAMAHDATPEDIKIIGAAKGSVIIELMACAAISTTVSKIILDALKVVEKVMNIRKIAIDSKHTQLLSKKLEQELEKEAEATKENGASEIIKNQIKELKLKQKNDSEKINALTKAITNLVGFIEKGGEVDFVIPDDINEEGDEGESPTESEFTQLRTAFEEIKLLENKIQLLENNVEEAE